MARNRNEGAAWKLKIFRAPITYYPLFFFFTILETGHCERFLKSWFNFPGEKWTPLIQLFVNQTTHNCCVILSFPFDEMLRVIIYIVREIESVKIILGCFLLIAGQKRVSTSRGNLSPIFISRREKYERTSATTR